MKHYHLETQRNKGTKTRSLFTVLCSLFMISAWLLSCGGSSEQEDENNVINNFKSTWNIYERFEMNDDGYIEYHALPWGGLVGDFLKNNLPMNLNGYEGITFEFAEPVPVPIQIVVAKNFKTVGKPGITSLTCSFDGQNVTSVDNIVLQASDTCDLVVKSVYLTPNYATWVSEPIWEGSCIFGDWTGSIEINGDKFNSAYEGDKIEFRFTTDHSNPDVTYWGLQTRYDGTDTPLQGNDAELNQWGSTSISKEATIYRIELTAEDIIHLRENGLLVNGYFLKVSSVNLMHKYYNSVDN